LDRPLAERRVDIVFWHWFQAVSAELPRLTSSSFGVARGADRPYPPTGILKRFSYQKKRILAAVVNPTKTDDQLRIGTAVCSDISPHPRQLLAEVGRRIV
jgi:hypothetical protein